MSATMIAGTARGLARLATPEEIEREDDYYVIVTDGGLPLLTDSEEDEIAPNVNLGYTHPNLHRRIDLDAVPTLDELVAAGIDPTTHRYPFVYYKEDGTPYRPSIALGVWDGINSYRTTTTYIHDEESTTCEIP